jgi:hypothetical protein
MKKVAVRQHIGRWVRNLALTLVSISLLGCGGLGLKPQKPSLEYGWSPIQEVVLDTEKPVKATCLTVEDRELIYKYIYLLEAY